MNIVTTRFGLIQASESDLVLIPEGLLGFRSYTRYLHLPDTEVAGLSWLQSVTAPDLAFGLVAPPLAVSDYRIEIRPGDRAALELEDERTALIYVILNRGMGGGLTVNLQGPLVFNPVRRLGRQLVLTSSRYPVRYPLETQATAPAPTCSRAGPVACNGLTRFATTKCIWLLTIPSSVVVTESPGNVIGDGHGPGWQEEGAENDAGPVPTPRRKYHHRR